MLPVNMPALIFKHTTSFTHAQIPKCTLKSVSLYSHLHSQRNIHKGIVGIAVLSCAFTHILNLNNNKKDHTSINITYTHLIAYSLFSYKADSHMHTPLDFLSLDERQAAECVNAPLKNIAFEVESPSDQLCMKEPALRYHLLGVRLLGAF